MSDNNSQDWVVGIKFVQQMKNASYAGIKRTPYTSSQPDDQLPASLPPSLSPSSPGLRCRNILNEKKRARECLTDQAERIVKRSRIEVQAGNIGDNVALPVPMATRTKTTSTPLPQDMATCLISTHELNSLFALNSC